LFSKDLSATYLYPYGENHSLNRIK